jgi:hypothetical protein
MQEEALSAPNPFDAEQLLLGCPKCKCTDLLFVACDEPGCWKPVSIGKLTKNGYRRTCLEHWPKSEQTA